jgi:uracil-DNA glycosylase
LQTDAVIRAINKERKGVVFLLWGAHAQAKAKLIDQARHHVLNAAHPSGLSASKGFYGCKHFSKTNALLEKQGKKPIDWQV